VPALPAIGKCRLRFVQLLLLNAITVELKRAIPVPVNWCKEYLDVTDAWSQHDYVSCSGVDRDLKTQKSHWRAYIQHAAFSLRLLNRTVHSSWRPPPLAFSSGAPISLSDNSDATHDQVVPCPQWSISGVTSLKKVGETEICNFPTDQICVLIIIFLRRFCPWIFSILWFLASDFAFLDE